MRSRRKKRSWEWNLFIWSLTRSSSARVYCWRVLLWITEMNDKFITFTKIIILLQLRRKKARRLMIITSQNKQYSNSVKLDGNRLKKTCAWCEANVTMLFKNFYEISWIESLKIKSMKISRIVFASTLNCAARKCLSHSFIITRFVKQLQLAFSTFDKVINFDWYHFFSFAVRRLFWKRAFSKLSRTYASIVWVYNYWLSAARMYIHLTNSRRILLRKDVIVKRAKV